MQKKDTLDEEAKSMQEAFKCGECLHFATHPLRSKARPCKEEGIRHFANAPKCFTPDVTKLAAGSDQLIQIVSIFNNFTYKQRRILIGMLRGRKKKLKFGTKVYFKAVGQDYVSNYLCGFVLGTTSSGETIVGGDPDRTRRGAAYTAIFSETENLLNQQQWLKHRKYLIEKGRVEDPKQPLRKFPKNIDPNLYEPKTLDTAPDRWFNKERKESKKAKRVIKDSYDVMRIR